MTTTLLNTKTGTVHTVEDKEAFFKKAYYPAEDYRELSQDELDSVVTFVCIQSHGTDDYFTDDTGDYDQEYHTISRNNQVVFYDVSVYQAKEWVQSFLERNADNPPYDTYSIKLAYWKHNNEPINLRQFEVYNE